MYRTPFIFLVLIVALIPWCSTFIIASPDNPPSQLRIELAIPLKHADPLKHLGQGKLVRRLRFRDASPCHTPDFHVVITNASDKRVQLWETWCSLGDSNLSFEFFGADGKTIHCEKLLHDWPKNYPSEAIIEPGEHFVIDVYFSSDLWTSPKFRTLKTDADGTIGMRAVYENEADKEMVKQGVWSGKMFSKISRVVAQADSRE